MGLLISTNKFFPEYRSISTLLCSFGGGCGFPVNTNYSFDVGVVVVVGL